LISHYWSNLLKVFTNRESLTPDGGGAITIENATGIATFSDLSYRYYCLTVVMGNRCSGSTCFYFDASCSTNCLVADFNFAHQYDGCTVEFEDWSESGTNSWQWNFGDGGIIPAQVVAGVQRICAD